MHDRRAQTAGRRVQRVYGGDGGLGSGVPGGGLQPPRHQHAYQAARYAVRLPRVPAYVLQMLIDASYVTDL